MKEITPEIKLRIFALYYDQQIMMHDGNKRPLLISSGTIALGLTPNYYLELTPLSQITDEDAIEVAKIAENRKLPHYSVDDFSIWKHEFSIDVRFLDNFNRVVNLNFDSDVLVYSDIDEVPLIDKRVEGQSSIIDFLRSRGYALPAFGFSVDDLVQAGVFKLKDNPAKAQ
ncbi:hypothetical protein ACLOAU_14530 [Niabella sp. CJ426]|uniref:hypothetical protein n=1 Tax=Niabella sp. CJ426 TaxID=3393740 RepID=UPI003CFBF9CF